MAFWTDRRHSEAMAWTCRVGVTRSWALPLLLKQPTPLHRQSSAGASWSCFVFYSPLCDIIPPDHGPASPTSGRGAQPKRSGRVAASALDDERHCCPGFLSECPRRLSDWTGSFSQCEGDPGASPGMETDEEVALTPDARDLLTKRDV
jgi:hypothetical protein